MAAMMDGYVVVDDRGVPRIVGSRSRVIDIVMEGQANSWTPEQIHEQHPDLSLAHIYAALAHYYAHQGELDRAIADGMARVAALREQSGESPIVKRLRFEGKLP